MRLRKIERILCEVDVNFDAFPELKEGNSYFFIQAMDGESGLALSEMYIGQFSPDRVAAILRCNVSELRQNNPVYIEDEQLTELRLSLRIDEDYLVSVFGEGRPKGSDLGVLAWNPGNGGLPYRLHTGRELLLMRDGDKPLSVFTGRIPADDSFIEVPEHLFDAKVKDEIFTKREIREMLDQPVRGIEGHRVVLYAKKGEEWRLNAYALVRSLGNKIGWSEPLIRLEGTLLGYQDWQNDAYIAQMKKKSSGTLS